MGKSSLLIWCGNLILQKDLHHVYLILRNLLYLIAKSEGVELTKEEAEAYFEEFSECELKDGDLKHIAGGDFENGTCVPRDRY
jgi:hypothetical protein